MANLQMDAQILNLLLHAAALVSEGSHENLNCVYLHTLCKCIGSEYLSLTDDKPGAELVAISSNFCFLISRFMKQVQIIKYILEMNRET